MDAPWIECGFVLDGRQVSVSVRRLSATERQRVAAEIAWFAEGLMTASPASEGWRTLFDRILSEDVAITLDEERMNAEGVWDELVCCTFAAFLSANDLDASIKSCLRTAARSA
jgi:hypothetical protein